MVGWENGRPWLGDKAFAIRRFIIGGAALAALGKRRFHPRARSSGFSQSLDIPPSSCGAIAAFFELDTE